jgi:hypothetical protein
VGWGEVAAGTGKPALSELGEMAQQELEPCHLPGLFSAQNPRPRALLSYGEDVERELLGVEPGPVVSVGAGTDHPTTRSSTRCSPARSPGFNAG